MTMQHGIIGEENPTRLPEAQFDDSQLKELKRIARFVKSADYKSLKEQMTDRITFYQKYLPDGRAVGAQTDTKMTGDMWIIANVVIGEFKNILNAYEQVSEMAKDGTTER